MNDMWHYAENGRQIGPIHKSKIEELISLGVVGRTTLVWREGMSKWVDAWTEFSFDGSMPPPLPGQSRLLPPVASSNMGYSSRDTLYSGAPARGFLEAISTCFNNYVTFSGRASRSEYWYFFLFTSLTSVALSVLEILVTGNSDAQALSGVFSLVTFLPGLAVTWRRLHDTDRSGWWFGGGVLGIAAVVALIGMAESNGRSEQAIETIAITLGLAILGWLMTILVFTCIRGDHGANRFG